MPALTALTALTAALTAAPTAGPAAGPVPLLLVDGHHLLHRAWYGFPARIWDRGKQHDRTGVFGFMALLRKARQRHAAGHELFAVFDAADGTAPRTAQQATYKANRPAVDAGLIGSLQHIKDALDVVGVHWTEQDGCEADDVIATLTAHARRGDRPVDVMSSDKDFHQLLDDEGVRLFNPVLAEHRRSRCPRPPRRHGRPVARLPRTDRRSVGQHHRRAGHRLRLRVEVLTGQAATAADMPLYTKPGFTPTDHDLTLRRLQPGHPVPARPRPDPPRLRRRTAGPSPGAGAGFRGRGDPRGPVAVAEPGAPAP